MNIDSIWFLLGLPVAFALGWLASRLDLRQLRTANRSAPKAYFKGLNYLLNEQQDAAIDAFIEAVQKDPDTTELHFALGNLFRRRGEYERAIRVHQHLLARADISAADRDRAQYALAMDFLKAGLLDHAETALRKLENGRFASQAQNALLDIYERSRDWARAGEMAQALERTDHADFKQRRAHYLCELAAEATQAKQAEQARGLLQQAAQIAPDAPRPHLQLAQLEQAEGHLEQAFALLQNTLQQLPACAPLVAPDFTKLALETGQAKTARDLLANLQQASSSIDVVEMLIQLDQQAPQANQTITPAQRYLDHLSKHSSLLAATRWLNLEKLQGDANQPVIERALQKAVQPLTRYRCAACGFETQRYYWHCPGCQGWDSYPPRRVEEL